MRRADAGWVAVAVSALVLGGCDPAQAQGTLAARVAGAPEGPVQFSFPARAGACGDGRTFFSVDDHTHIGVFTTADGARDACMSGPLRIVLERADRQVIAVRTYIGPLSPAATGTTELGAVPARDAADYLLDLAATLDGKPGRDAILPAALADGVDASGTLARLARDGARPVDTRRAAIRWYAREAETPEALRRAGDLLAALARDAGQPHPVRQQALGSLGELAQGSGIPRLVQLAAGEDDPWLVRESMAALARSGDPRARAHLRDVVARPGLPDATMAVVVRGLAGRYATADDAATLRRTYAHLPGDRSRRAAIDALAERGGSENTQWLLGIASDRSEPVAVRRHAINVLARSDDPRVRTALAEIVVR